METVQGTSGRLLIAVMGSIPAGGSRNDARAGNVGKGSIPAGTEEPSGCRARSDCARVYPRRSGGAILSSDEPTIAVGLSPQVRGEPLTSKVLGLL